MNLNRNTLASALPALGKLVCRTSPLGFCKAINLEAEDGTLRLTTSSVSESITYEMEFEGADEFSCPVGFDEFRGAVRSGRGKDISITYENGPLQIGDVSLLPLRNVEWPDIGLKVEAENCLLPDGVVGLFAQAAQIVDRNEPREILRGINLSADGITVTNGKELLNYDFPLDLESSITIPLPLALMQSKATHAGLLFHWPMENGTGFSIIVGPWCWTGKAVQGIYPNWKQVIPDRKTLDRSIVFPPESARQLEVFLKNVPDSEPHNVLELSEGQGMLLNVFASGVKTSVTAELSGDWSKPLYLNKTYLLRMLREGHRKMEVGSDYTPFYATGGVGRYIAMPMHYPACKPEENTQAEQSEQPQPSQEETKMEKTEMKVVPAPVQAVAPKQEPENNLSTLDDLSASIEAFKQKLKASLDDAAALARKVKEVQISQKQKERDFVQAKRALDRIRMVSGF